MKRHQVISNIDTFNILCYHNFVMSTPTLSVHQFLRAIDEGRRRSKEDPRNSQPAFPDEEPLDTGCSSPELLKHLASFVTDEEREVIRQHYAK